MKIVDVVQGSPEWVNARVGLPTCSSFDKIMTPRTRKLSSQYVDYRNFLLAEWFVGHPLEAGKFGGGQSGSYGFTDRGRDMEDEARRWYMAERDVDVRRVGFVTRDDGKVGGSPDGLVGEDGIIEIKCGALWTAIGYFLGSGASADYLHQIHGYLYITGRQWADVISYHPDIPTITRVQRDDDYIDALGKALNTFVADLDTSKLLLAPHRPLTMAEARAECAA